MVTHIFLGKSFIFLSVNCHFISFQINVLKKSIAKYENDFEAQNGHAITQGDRMTDIQLVRMYESLRQLQTEKRCIKADPVEYALKVQALKLQKERDDKLDMALKSDKPMAELVRDIEEVSLMTKFLLFYFCF